MSKKATGNERELNCTEKEVGLFYNLGEEFWDSGCQEYVEDEARERMMTELNVPDNERYDFDIDTNEGLFHDIVAEVGVEWMKENSEIILDK